MSATVPPGQQATLAEACELAQDAADGAESDGGPETAQASGELDCGHDAAYAQGEDCLICDRRFNTDEERRARTAAASDDLEGKL